LAAEPEAVGQVFNIGNRHEITIRHLAEKVRTMTSSSSEIVLIPYDQAYESGFEDMPRRVPDISKIRNAIGYEPRVELGDTIARVIDYFRKR
jgi:UDP-glucose 4-epimerase